MSILKDSVSVIREAERLVTGLPFGTNESLTGTVVDTLIRAPMFVFTGLRERAAAFLFGIGMIPVWWCVLWLLVWITSGGAESPHGASSWVMATLFASATVLFRLPSQAGQAGIHQRNVDALVRHLATIASDTRTLEGLQAGISAFDTATGLRLARLNWMLGLTWAGLVWATGHWVLDASVPTSLRQEAVNQIVGTFLVFLFFGIGANAYEVAIRLVKQTIDFAFLQAKQEQSLIEQLSKRAYESAPFAPSAAEPQDLSAHQRA